MATNLKHFHNIFISPWIIRFSLSHRNVFSIWLRDMIFRILLIKTFTSLLEFQSGHPELHWWRLMARKRTVWTGIYFAWLNLCSKLDKIRAIYISATFCLPTVNNYYQRYEAFNIILNYHKTVSLANLHGHIFVVIVQCSAKCNQRTSQPFALPMSQITKAIANTCQLYKAFKL